MTAGMGFEKLNSSCEEWGFGNQTGRWEEGFQEADRMMEGWMEFGEANW